MYSVLFYFLQKFFLSLTGISVKSGLDEILKDDFFKTTTIAVDVYDLTANEYLYQFNEHRLLNPASNMKLLTSAAGLVFLGPAYNFVTSLQYTGEIINHVLYGDLYIVGTFDPVFNTSNLDKFLEDIRKAGLAKYQAIYMGMFLKRIHCSGDGAGCGMMIHQQMLLIFQR